MARKSLGAADRLLGVEEVAGRCGVKVRTVRTWIFERRLPVVKLGRYVRVAESDLDRFIRAARIEPEP